MSVLNGELNRWVENQCWVYFFYICTSRFFGLFDFLHVRNRISAKNDKKVQEKLLSSFSFLLVQLFYFCRYRRKIYSSFQNLISHFRKNIVLGIWNRVWKVNWVKIFPEMREILELEIMEKYWKSIWKFF